MLNATQLSIGVDIAFVEIVMQEFVENICNYISLVVVLSHLSREILNVRFRHPLLLFTWIEGRVQHVLKNQIQE